MVLLETTLPTKEDIALAADAAQSLAEGEIYYSKLPPGIIQLISVALSEISQGRNVSLNSDKAELTTFEAAAYLNVSRPYVIKLLDEGKIPHRRVGTHRRIPADQLEAYRKAQDEASYAAMAELQAMGQEEALHG